MLTHWTRSLVAWMFFLPSRALQRSKDSPKDGSLGKKIDSIGAEPTFNVDFRKPPHSVVWRQAMRKDLDGLTSKDIIALVDKLPEGTKAVAGRLVYRWKLNENNEILRAESRMVISGSTEEFRLDIFDSYAPTPECLVDWTADSSCNQSRYQDQL